MPQWGTWVEAQFSLKVLDNPEAAVRYTSYIKFASRRPPESTPEEDKPERHKVQFDTRCVIVAHEPDQYLIIRNKFGVERRLELQTMKVTREVRRGNAEKTHPLSKQPLSDAARRPVRMLGRHGQAYLNVGFRTVRRLWSPPPPRLPSAIPTRSP
jgi:hypothetical protein